MGDPSELLARLATAVATAPGDDLVSRLGDAARRLLDADGVAIVVGTGQDDSELLHATDEVAAALADLHDVLGVGPAVEARRTGEPVVVDLVDVDPVWSAFAEAAARRTAAELVLALPMRAWGRELGVLCLHHLHRRPLGDTIPSARVIADAVAAALVHDPAAATEEAAGGTWSERAQVHQATGMVVAQLAIGVGDAMAILRAHAFALDQSLVDVARAVLRRDLVFSRDLP